MEDLSASTLRKLRSAISIKYPDLPRREIHQLARTMASTTGNGRNHRYQPTTCVHIQRIVEMEYQWIGSYGFGLQQATLERVNIRIEQN